PAKKSPAAPFTTSTLQQEASRKLYFSVAQTMSVAQKLYEGGHITYMRTDSVNLSDLALNTARKEITEQYGDKYTQTRKYSTKSKGAQEAHEAIRPTFIDKHSAGGDANQKKLYDLIWKRTIASQMSDAQLERTVLRISTPSGDLDFVARGEVIKFDGFLKVYLEGTDDDDLEEQEGMLPATQKGEQLGASELVATQRFTKHPPRFTEASLVKKLEELGIGRPSTYAPTISTIQKRNYVEKSDLEGEKREYVQYSLVGNDLKEQKLSETTGADKGKLIPTDIGTVVNDFLVEHFKEILDYHFTANVEEQFDEIARGQEQWDRMIDAFYKDFHPHLKDVEENSERAKGERLLGEDPKSGKPVYARIGRYGPMIQIGEADDEEKPQFASLMKGQHINDISLEEALELFKLPRTLGEFEEFTVTANVGRFGPYVRYGNNFVSMKPKEGDDPMSISLERAIELIKDKQEADKNKFIARFDDEKPVIEVLNGRYGPYIKSGRKNYKIPKGTEPESLTREDCLEIINAAPEPKKRKTRKK
ncbi:MAG: DNA topoisomerase, partial [Owenweeksia sp.]